MDKPMSKTRRCLVQSYYKFWLMIILASYGGCFTTVYEKDVDYSQWLGPDHNSIDASKGDKTSTIVSNHMGWFEVLCLMTGIHPAFICKKETESIPILAGLAKAVQCIFVDRAGTAEAKDAVLGVIS